MIREEEGPPVWLKPTFPTIGSSDRVRKCGWPAELAKQADINRQMRLFRNRHHAGHLLARKLGVYKNKHPLVLGIPRGAVPMAKVIADALGGDLDVVLVHKLSHPEQIELAIGAIDDSGNAILTDYAAQVDPEYLESEKQRQLGALRQRRARYTPLRPPIDLQTRIVIVVDDGVATGSPMVAALRAVRAATPKELIAAMAVASPNAAQAIDRECDAAFCLKVPSKFHAVGQFFADFAQVEDEEVISVLQHGQAQPRSAAG
jgi:putative phosphoribosyl transferase